jgi:hypothetical protein
VKEKSSPLSEVADTVARGWPFAPVMSDSLAFHRLVVRNTPLRGMTLEPVKVTLVNLERSVPLLASRVTSAVVLSQVFRGGQRRDSTKLAVWPEVVSVTDSS